MQTREKLAALRVLMKKRGLAAYYVPSVDPHQSEYLPECWMRRHWLSGFTGSAGDLLVTPRRAALWTDSRYFLQAEKELAGSGIELMKQGLPETPGLVDWAKQQLRRGQNLGVDPRVFSVVAADAFAEPLAEKGVKVKYVAQNLVDAIWADQPEPGLAPLKSHSSRLAGETHASKLKRLRAEMKTHGVKAHVLGALDAIAWLFNIRSADIDYTPVAISYAVITDRSATLYVDPRKVTTGIERHLKPHVKLAPYGAVADALRALAKKKLAVMIDPATTNKWVEGLLRGCELVYGASPVMAMKAIKNPAQVVGITAAHVRDGVAMVKFLKWLPGAVRAGGQTELTVANKLNAIRFEAKECKDISFTTISGYAGNGAIVHYSVSEKSAKKMKPKGLYLIDSGGQYPDGTTDITRTVLLGGKPTPRMKEMYTRVLKGNIQLSITPFPAGTTGRRLEMFARQALWAGGANYMHGTGHGLGQYLGVHEGPCSLKDVPGVALEPGHLLSIEPGHYEAGRFGVRIENLAFVERDEKLSKRSEVPWYIWSVVTLCPIDTRLIDRKLLTPDERAWLNAYHKRVQRTLSKHLDREHKEWLKKACRPI